MGGDGDFFDDNFFKNGFGDLFKARDPMNQRQVNNSCLGRERETAVADGKGIGIGLGGQ